MPELKAELTDDAVLDILADRIAERLAIRLGGARQEHPEELVAATEIARLYGKTRSWVYEHAGELGAVRLGSGARPRLAFDPARVAEAFAVAEPPQELPRTAPRRRHRARKRGETDTDLLPVHKQEA